MAESVRDNRLVWGLVALGVVLVLLLWWVWSIGNGLAQADQRGQQLEARFADVASADAIGDLQQKQADLEARMAALQMPDLGPTQQQLDEIKADLGTVQTELTRLAESGIGDLTTRLAAVEAAVSDPGPIDLAGLPATLDALHTDVEALQTQLGSFAPARVDELAGALDALATRVAAVEGPGLPQLVTDMGALDSRVDAVDSRVGAVEVKLADITLPDLAPLETRLGTVAADLETLRTDVAAAATVTQIGALETQLAALDVRAGEAATGVADVRSATAELSNEIGRLDAALATKAESAEVTALSDQLDGIRERVASLPAPDTATFEADVAALRGDLDALEGRVATLARADDVAALRSDLAALAEAPPQQVRPPQVLERIYFGSSSTSVADAEQPKVEAIARKLASAPGTVALVGFSDSKGPAELNRSLSLRRAAAVRLALLAAGVDPAAVTSVVGLGEDAPPIDAGDNADEAGNRVVLIYGY